MKLYDGKSAITWHGRGKMSAAKMRKDPRYAGLFKGDAVLFDNGAGTAYGWKPLSELKVRWGVIAVEPDKALILIEEAMRESWDSAGIPSLAEVALRLDEQDAALMELAGLIAGGE